MNLIEVFALLAIAALTISIFMCLRINRRKAVGAARLIRSLDRAIRHQGTLFSVGSLGGSH